jgi:hypothetical protein
LNNKEQIKIVELKSALFIVDHGISDLFEESFVQKHLISRIGPEQYALALLLQITQRLSQSFVVSQFFQEISAVWVGHQFGGLCESPNHVHQSLELKAVFFLSHHAEEKFDKFIRKHMRVPIMTLELTRLTIL